MPHLLIVIAVASLAAVPGGEGFLDVRGTGGEIRLDGRLSEHVMPGPPNYEAVDQGDRPEGVYILTLTEAICVDDGGDFADPHHRFTSVQLYSSNAQMRDRLAHASGRSVSVEGEGFAAFNGHHRAPLVIDVRGLTVEGRGHVHR